MSANSRIVLLVGIVSSLTVGGLVACSSDPAPQPGTSKQDAGADATTSGGGDDAGGMGTKDGGGGQNEGGVSVLRACDGGTNCPPGAPCTDAGQCTTGVCFFGGNQSFCTKACTSAADCPVPDYTGVCNNKGFCRF